MTPRRPCVVPFVPQLLVAAGYVNDLELTNRCVDWLKVRTTAECFLTGFKPGCEDRTLCLTNEGPDDCTLKHMTISDPGNRIFLADEADTVVPAGYSVLLRYDVQTSPEYPDGVWRETSKFAAAAACGDICIGLSGVVGGTEGYVLVVGPGGVLAQVVSVCPPTGIIDGGTTDQSGGQREGGPVPQLSAGGEREGGPVPAAAPAVLVDCCPDPVRIHLFLHVTGGGLDGVYPLDYDAVFGAWVYSGAFGSCPPADRSVRLFCSGGLWSLYPGTAAFAYGTAMAVCDSLRLTFTGMGSPCQPVPDPMSGDPPPGPFDAVVDENP